MKEKRSLFEFVFGKKDNIDNHYLSKLEMLNGDNVMWSSCRNDPYSVKVARQCIDRIATHGAKMIPKHILKQGDRILNVNGDINFLLQHKPNPIMTKFDFLYKVLSTLYSYNNAFIFKVTDRNGFITAFYPVIATEDDLLQDRQGNIFLRFKFINGRTYTIPYEDLIHLRLFYNENDIFGSSNDVLKIDMETAIASSEGIKNAIYTSNKLKGLLQYTNALLKPEDIKKSKENFVKDFLGLENKSGIVALDGKAEFKEINMKPITLDKDQLERVNYNIFDYFGVSEKIINNSYTADEWNAFYEGVIEPRAIQLSDAFTNSIFNEQAIRNGNEIVFTINKIQYANIDQKVKLLQTILPLGVLTKDTVLEILDLEKIGGEEGSKILQSLNYIDTSIANNYQGGGNNGE